MGRSYLIVYKNISAIFLKIPSYYRIIAYFILIMGWSFIHRVMNSFVYNKEKGDSHTTVALLYGVYFNSLHAQCLLGILVVRINFQYFIIVFISLLLVSFLRVVVA